MTRRRGKALAQLGVPLDLATMEARLAEALPEGENWQYEPKWDGFRCLAYRAGPRVELKSRSGKSLDRYFPEVIDNLQSIDAAGFVMDGELIITVEGALSFDALQARLHPAASRIARLARETPAEFVAFDCLSTGSRKSLLAEPFAVRRVALERLASVAPVPGIRVTPYTRDMDQAFRWLRNRQVSLDGVIAKRLDLPYRPAERAMVKVKTIRTADCVVGGFRYETKRRLVGSLLLGLYDDDGVLHHVGFTSALADQDKPALTKKLERLVYPPGFTGNAPGGPSRWSTERSAQWQPLRPKLVVEVRYDQVTDKRFRHGTRLMRWRPEKSPVQCTFDQIALPISPLELGASKRRPSVRTRG